MVQENADPLHSLISFKHVQTDKNFFAIYGMSFPDIPLQFFFHLTVYFVHFIL